MELLLLPLGPDRVDKRRYKRRNGIKTMSGRLKDLRSVAIHYDKYEKVILSAVLAAATVMFWRRNKNET